jgi:pimeloyl-ACP methyl ester carboxylesterase
MGLSSFQQDRRISDWSRDVVDAADQLGLERFAVLGYSGGGPYAVACAQAIPQRLTQVGIISGAGPFDQPGLADGISPDNLRFFGLIRDKPGISRLILRTMGWMARFAPDRVVANAIAALPEPDRQVVARPEIQKGFLKMIQESLRQGPRGAQRDTLLMVSAWDIRPQDIHVGVQMWHGEADCNAPPAMGRWVADAIAGSTIQFFPGEGHLSLWAKYPEQILRTFAS